MIILIQVARVYEGIYRCEARESQESEILPLVEKGFDFQGTTLHIFVLPRNCELDRDRALAVAKRYADAPFERMVDITEYSKLQASMQGGLKRNQEYLRRKYKGVRKPKRDKHYLDVSTDEE